ncbi:hypothetical protein SAMN05192584_12747 [Streptomyces pini]|uniref:PIN domain-containing protein n=2 Tax=Streptomyces pini TaxID=1520580 RepID=A0A1I4KLG6_9ACTN|nr:hypothetical protein SAMN05192584_12747 [Streptomyces pini]
MRPTEVGRTACITCVTGPDLADRRRIGAALGKAELPPRKRPDAVDAVDALVALSAVRHGSAVVFTSDPGDIGAYLQVMNAHDVHIVPV